MTPAQVATQLRRRAWQQPWPGVYADAGVDLDPTQRAVAAVLASGGAGQPAPLRPGGRAGLRAIACGRTAARVHGFLLIDDDDPATGAREASLDEVAVRTSRRDLVVAPDGATRSLCRRRLLLGAGDVRLVPGGLHVTSRLRTIADCAAALSREALVCLLDDALHRGLVRREGLAELVRARAWCVGAVALREAVAAADARAESPAETLTRLLLLPVLPALVPQVRVHDDRRVVARLDLGDEELRLGIEADGRVGHAGEQMVAKDRRRDRTTERLGWRTERFTWFDLRRRQDEVVTVALAAAASQRARVGSPE
ncbi:MAG: hypothetical protein JWN08_2249 [Frankiales bacterium]|nr:hypothetical protein [Frankiales bacterium]